MRHATLHSSVPILAVVVGALASVAAPASEGPLVMNMDTVGHKAPVDSKTKQPRATVEQTEGMRGGGVKFSFPENARGAFCTAWHNPTVNWDEYAGLSFWVKGDGSGNWGGIELIDGNDYGKRYGCAFPLKSTEWQKVAIPWCDLVPEIPKAELIDVAAGYKPSGFRNIWFGKWFYWGRYPAVSFSIDEIRLEKTIPVDATDYTPARGGIGRTLAKLRAKEPVTIVTMGDSLTDYRHWANRPVNWPTLFLKELKEIFGYERIALENPAIGGTQLSQNLVLAPRDVVPHQPDLVTICFGYNDWDGGMRGDKFAKWMAFGVDRIRRLTGGKAEILLFTTAPAVARWKTMAELAEAVRTVAREKKTGLVDIEAAFHAAGGDDPARLYCRDKTHMGPEGHALIARTVLEAVRRGAAP